MVQAAEIKSAPALLAGIQARAAIADRGYDSNALRALLAALGIKAVVPAKHNRKVPIEHDRTLYRERNQIKRGFNKLKPFRRIATRFHWRDVYFSGFLHLDCILLWLS